MLAVVTAVVDAGGASRITSAQATLGAYRPALAVITAVSAFGALAALSGLRSARQGQVPAPVPVPARVPAVIVEAGAIADVATGPPGRGWTWRRDLITGTARELEEDCATPLCL